MSWIYQIFFQWCPPDRGIYQYPKAVSIRAVISMRPGSCIGEFRSTGIQFAWRVYDNPAMQALCPPWFLTEVEWGTWLSAVPLVCSNIVWFHQVNRVKRQFNGEQQVSDTPVNLDRFLMSTSRGEDVWWPDRLADWYEGWRRRFDPGHRISIHHSFDTRLTREYYDWWRGACRVRHLSGQAVLEDPRLVELPPGDQLGGTEALESVNLESRLGGRGPGLVGSGWMWSLTRMQSSAIRRITETSPWTERIHLQVRLFHLFHLPRHMHCIHRSHLEGCIIGQFGTHHRQVGIIGEFQHPSTPAHTTS
ncbi:hypothetical protein Ahy_B05g078385 [Arachis hypogaea]|uniref:Aminotransferase-like plant mobile domain-containing protein n=1 Tax=Arachis hypogaea TaxID=3818 RepID=A0A444Z6Z6_ARAHY|nr:hypothetical protein Ahy_B05g078385 [Arachis hypogaea]